MPPRPSTLFPRLLALFVIAPIAELALLIWVGGQIGFWPTMALIIVTAVVGAWLAKREGLAVWQRFQKRLASGQMPGRELTDGLIILVSAAFLLTPGVLTDVVGLLGLFPVTRAGIRAYVSRRLQKGIQQGTVNVFTFGATSRQTAPPPPGDPDSDDVIDVPFEEYKTPREPRH